MSDGYVLDASAVICLARNEPGAEVVLAALPRSWICSVNLSEVVARMTDLGVTSPDMERVLEGLHLRVLPFDAELAVSAGLMRPATRPAGLSLGDRACLALAAKLGATAMTTDRIWSTVQGIAPVVLVR